MFTGHSVCKSCRRGKQTKYSTSNIFDTVTTVSHNFSNYTSEDCFEVFCYGKKAIKM